MGACTPAVHVLQHLHCLASVALVLSKTNEGGHGNFLPQLWWLPSIGVSIPVAQVLHDLNYLATLTLVLSKINCFFLRVS